MKRVGLAIALLLALPQVASAVVTFQQLDGNTFTVSHKVKWIGSRGQAMDLVYEKAASLCIAAGYSHMKILDQESMAAAYSSVAAAASPRARRSLIICTFRVRAAPGLARTIH